MGSCHNTKYFTDESSANIYVQPFADFGFKSIFSFHQFIEDTLTNFLQNGKRYSTLSPALALSNNLSGANLLLDFTAGSFHAVYLTDKKVNFYNAFEIENHEEFNYYLLLMCKQLKIDQQLTSVFVSGIIHEDDSNFKVLNKYFSKVSLSIPEANNLDYSLLEDMPAQYYTNLLALNLCE